jgi:hypothetical protein
MMQSLQSPMVRPTPLLVAAFVRLHSLVAAVFAYTQLISTARACSMFVQARHKIATFLLAAKHPFALHFLRFVSPFVR